jgi:hypothetical protein
VNQMLGTKFQTTDKKILLVA